MNDKYTWPIAGVLMILAVIGGMQQLDARDFESAAQAERREWMYAVQLCHRAFGPSTQPEYDDQDKLICVSRRGERLALVEATK